MDDHGFRSKSAGTADQPVSPRIPVHGLICVFSRSKEIKTMPRTPALLPNVPISMNEFHAC
jgi:hypothetical protein